MHKARARRMKQLLSGVESVNGAGRNEKETVGQEDVGGGDGSKVGETTNGVESALGAEDDAALLVIERPALSWVFWDKWFRRSEGRGGQRFER